MKFAALASAALLLSIWIVIPGPQSILFAISVGAIEVWPIIALINIGILVWILRSGRSSWHASAAFIAVAALLCALTPPVAYLLRGPYIPLIAFLRAPGGEKPVAVRPLANGSIVYAPPSARALPVIVTLYGGAWERGSPLNDTALNTIIASWGYVVIAVDYPHAPQMRWPAQRVASERQFDAIARSARDFGGDPSRIALLGHSSGAQIAMAASSRTNSVRALITYESPVDLALGYEHPSVPDVINIRGILQDLCGGTPVTKAACYRDASPRYMVRRGIAPVMMIAAGRDHVADVGYERLLRDTLRRAGVSVDYLELPWADHAFETVAIGFHNHVAMWYLRRFLKRHLTGGGGGTQVVRAPSATLQVSGARLGGASLTQ